jgi:hypothetical protein
MSRERAPDNRLRDIRDDADIFPDIVRLVYSAQAAFAAFSGGAVSIARM